MSEVDGTDIQTTKDGVGPMYHRIYSTDLDCSPEQARFAMRELQSNLDRFSPHLLARFEKLEGREHELQVGDVFQIHISGPWNGPVRVSSVSESDFVLETLSGHLEAGEIHFRMIPITDECHRFEIESLARSRDHIVDIFYDKIPIAKWAQTEMWCEFLCSFVCEVDRDLGKTPPEKVDVEIRTERRDEKTGKWELQ